MTTLPRLVPDNYRSIFAFLDPDSQAMMAIACRSVVTLTSSSTFKSYRTIRAEYMELSRLLRRKRLPLTMEIVPLDLYRQWAYRGKVIDIHWNSMEPWFKLCTIDNPQRKLYDRLGCGYDGPFSNIGSWLSMLSSEHHKIFTDNIFRDRPYDAFSFYGGISGYKDNFTKRWKQRAEEVEKMPLPGRRKKANPFLSEEDKQVIREGLINPLEKLMNEIEEAMKIARSPYGTKERIVKDIIKTRKRIEKGRELYM